MKYEAAVLSPSQAMNIPSTRALPEQKPRAVPRGKLCRYCNCRVPLLRSLRKANFCSQAHERAYIKNLNEIALERLRISADRLKIAMQESVAEAIANPLKVA
jgi:hypothetical protein